MTRPSPLIVRINNQPVEYNEHRLTGLEVKQGAISQGVEIGLDFQLSMQQGNGALKVVGDSDVVTLTKNTQFRAVAPDDNS